MRPPDTLKSSRTRGTKTHGAAVGPAAAAVVGVGEPKVPFFPRCKMGAWPGRPHVFARASHPGLGKVAEDTDYEFWCTYLKGGVVCGALMWTASPLHFGGLVHAGGGGF